MNVCIATNLMKPEAPRSLYSLTWI